MSKVTHDPPTKKDPILRFYKRCSKWTVDVDDNPNASYEPRQWLESEQMINLLREIREKLDLEHLTIGMLKTTKFTILVSMIDRLPQKIQQMMSC